MSYLSDPRLPEVVKVKDYKGIAFRVFGWQTIHEEDTGCEIKTGKVVCIMVGDDRKFYFDRDELEAIDETAYCHVCGQLGCTHDGR